MKEEGNRNTNLEKVIEVLAIWKCEEDNGDEILFEGEKERKLGFMWRKRELIVPFVLLISVTGNW